MERHVENTTFSPAASDRREPSSQYINDKRSEFKQPKIVASSNLINSTSLPLRGVLNANQAQINDNTPAHISNNVNNTTAAATNVTNTGNVTRIYVARHAEHVGSSLVAQLSRRGSLQASAVAKTLRRHKSVSVIYSSTRCRETAEMLSTIIGVPIIYDDRLRNWDGGKLTALSLEEIKTRYPEIYQKRYLERNPDFKVPGGESLKERFDRVKSMLKDIGINCVGKSVVIVTHGGIIDDMYRMANNTPLPRLTGLLKPYGCLSVLSKASVNGPWQYEQWADVNHLPQVVAESPSGGHLYLFPHQVAGSCPMLRGDRGELCKPATSVELAAYQNVAEVYPQLMEFVPEFMGTVDIDVKHILADKMSLCQPLHHMPEPLHDEDEQGNTNENEASADVSMDDDVSSAALAPVQDRGKQVAEATAVSNQESAQQQQQAIAYKNTQSSTSSASGDRKSCSGSGQLVPDGKLPFSVTNLWTLFTAERWKKVMPSAEGDGRYVYLILENLSHGLRKPHILDLKIGTRQHGRFDSAEKQKRKESRCATSTSASMGLRLAGMQKWSTLQRRFVLKDKYWGRSLDDQGLENTLINFVNDDKKSHCNEYNDLNNNDYHDSGAGVGNGSIDSGNGHISAGGRSLGERSISSSTLVSTPTPRVAVVKEIIAQLKAMMAVLLTTRWRFFGSSILIVYDSDPPGSDSTLNEDTETASKIGVNANNNTDVVHNTAADEVNGVAISESEKNQSSRSKRSSSGGRLRTRSWSGVESHERVSVRLIDFSHCDQDVDQYDTHDEGVVFGLRNLIRVYNELLAKYSDNSNKCMRVE